MVFGVEGSASLKDEMSFAEIEAELRNLSADELRRLALSSWNAFVEKESHGEGQACVDEDPETLAALDVAIREVDAKRAAEYSGDDVRGLVRKWTSR